MAEKRPKLSNSDAENQKKRSKNNDVLEFVKESKRKQKSKFLAVAGEETSISTTFSEKMDDDQVDDLPGDNFREDNCPDDDSMIASDGGEGDGEALKKFSLDGDQKFKKQGSSSNRLYAPATREEMQSLKETEYLYKSNLVRLQITELLKEVSPVAQPKAEGQLEEYLKHLKGFIQSIPSSDSTTVQDAIKSLPKDVKYPLRTSVDLSSVPFVFNPPSSVKVFGSWLVKTHFRKNYNINMALEIPSECLHERDYLGHRYFHKRALFLCVLAHHLKQSGLCNTVVFSEAGGNGHTPVLVVTPVDSCIRHCSVILHPCTPHPLTKLLRLAPNRNSVRDYAVKSLSVEALREGDNVHNPTPHYNNSLLLETTDAFTRHLEEIYSATEQCTAFRDAILLLKVWLKQRQFDLGFGSIGGFEVSMLLVYLVQRKLVNRMMSCYQMVRVLWTFVAASAWHKEGISMAEESSQEFSLDVFNQHFDVVFLDSSGLINILADLGVGAYVRFKQEAEEALKLLDSSSVEAFEKLFMTSVVFAEHFDMLIHMDLSAVTKRYLKNKEKDSDVITCVLDQGDNLSKRILQDVEGVLMKGLGKRARLAVFEGCGRVEWKVGKKHPAHDCCVTLGLLLDTDYAFNVIELGPPADAPEAVEFRQFWGEKSHMRRFQDSTIKEVVLWNGESAFEKRAVPFQIVQYLLEKYFGVPASCIESKAQTIERILSLPAYSGSRVGGDWNISTGEELRQQLMKDFSELSSQLRDLSDLPLAINTLQGVSPVFRRTEVFPPDRWNGKVARKSISDPIPGVQPFCFFPSSEGPVPRYVPAPEVVCGLETSAKWPDDLAAIARVKTAFYTHLSQSLKSSKYRILSSPTTTHIDVLKNGFVFRVRIVYEREIALMKEELKYLSAEQAKRHKVAIRTTELAAVITPKLTAMLSGVADQYQAYGSTARMCKRWISAQMFANHLSEEAVDLIVAAMFLSPQPHAPPATPLCGFVRFLKFLGHFKWSSMPLIVNINSELSDEDVEDVKSHFSANRPSLPAMFIATSPDCHTSSFTLGGPQEPVLCHLQSVCRKAHAILSDQLSTAAQQNSSGDREGYARKDVKHVFRPSLKMYHVLIHLDLKSSPRQHQSIDSPPGQGGGVEALPPAGSSKHLPVVMFDSVELYLKELEELYSDFALFFHDKFGGKVIGVVLKPSTYQARSFKVSKANCMKPTASKSKSAVGEVVTDVDSLAGDFKLLGQGLVSLVEVVKTSM